MLKEIDRRTTTGTEQLLSMRQGKGLIPHNEVSKKRFKSEDLVGYKIVEPGQLVMNRMRASVGLFAASHEHGLVSPDYAVFQPLREIDLDYLMHLFRTPSMGATFRRESKGMGTGHSGFLRLYTDRFGAIPVSIPPFETQGQIVNLIKAFDSKINKFIHNKRRLIELLKEQKQNIINQAVTRGLDPNVKLKPSGVEWIGDVPEHWEVIRLKNCISHIEQGWSPQCDSQPANDNEYGVLKVGCVNGEHLDINQNKKLPNNLKPIHSLSLRAGDILVSRANTRELLGLAALAEKDLPLILVCDKLFRFRASKEFASPKFLVRAIRAPSSRVQIESSTNGASSSMQNIGQGVIWNLWVSLPPILEQEKILGHIQRTTSILDRAIIRANREIDLIREYRTRLISDVVTGQVDVRHIAVPDIAEEDLAPLDEDDPEAEDLLKEALDTEDGA